MLSSVRSTVAEELAFGLENRAVPRLEMLRRVARTAELDRFVRAHGADPAELSGASCAGWVACAVIAEPEVLVPGRAAGLP